MSLQTILMPMFAQVALTFGLLFWMAYLRIGALRAGLTAPQAIALREPNWPPRATQIANAFHNQLETPLLFYALILISLQTETAELYPPHPQLAFRHHALCACLCACRQQPR